MTSMLDALARAGVVRKPASAPTPQRVTIVVTRVDPWNEFSYRREKVVKHCYNCGEDGHTDKFCRYPKK